jgi:preprotein translocase subunit SecY
MALKDLLKNLPEVRSPDEKKLSFNVKLKWTLIVLISFFILANIPLYGLSKNALDKFEYLAIILGTDFGSIISLGIGPIVMASIILQLLVGSQIIKIDTSTEEGKKYFQGLQKLLVFFFVIFEATVYVSMRGLEAMPGLGWLVIFQLCLGGLAIVFMDELTTKWGFGSGVSLFIAAGVGWRLFTGLFGFLGQQGTIQPTGKVLLLISSVINGDNVGAMLALATIVVTVLIFLVVVWAQSLKVEVPLSFDRIRGYSIRWPLSFFYSSVLPVILTAALVANINLVAGLLENWLGHPTFLGGFSQGQAISGLAFWISETNLIQGLITGSLRSVFLLQAFFHLLIYMILSTIFAVFWVKTSGMDASSQAKNIIASGLQIPGFRKDQRVLESILARYIMPLTVMGGAAIGLLSAAANMFGALTGGTSILLAVMIMYQFYQNIAHQHSVDMHPALRKLM